MNFRSTSLPSLRRRPGSRRMIAVRRRSRTLPVVVGFHPPEHFIYPGIIVDTFPEVKGEDGGPCGNQGESIRSREIVPPHSRQPGGLCDTHVRRGFEMGSIVPAAAWRVMIQQRRRRAATTLTYALKPARGRPRSTSALGTSARASMSPERALGRAFRHSICRSISL